MKARDRKQSEQSGAAQPHMGKVIGVSVAAAVGGLLFGFDTAVVNGAVDAIQEDFALGEAVLGFTVAITLLGCAAGAWFAGELADRLGRKRVMFGAAVLFLVNSIGSGFAILRAGLA